MQKIMLLGDEAIAQGAIDAGISGFYGYPGTPSTEIMEYAQHSKDAAEKNIHRKWAANEKTATEGALGMSYAGKRAMVTMKHVGLNVAADCFVNAGITGANGGMLVLSADDPSMHSSQNEQDSRFYAKFSFIPILEPSNQQEAYDMAFHGFELSEKYKMPVLLRVTTRLAHSRSGVQTRAKIAQNAIKLPEDPRQFVLLPAIAKKRYNAVLKLQDELESASENSPFNKYINGSDRSMGIVACGLAYNYLMENFQNQACPYPILKISQYPLPRKMLEKMAAECKSILVLEEGMPLVEEQLRGFYNKPFVIKGRLDGTVNRVGELNPNIVKKAVFGIEDVINAVPEIVAARPPKMCDGCSHIDTYTAIKEAIKDKYGDGHVFADIGCYTLGALPPFECVNTTVDMGASITMAKGAHDAGLFPAVAIIGDSTFCHSGMTGLLDAVIENSNIVVFIEDNSTTGMTGGQVSHAVNRLPSIVAGLGVHPDHIRVMTPIKKNHEELVKIINEEVAYNGVSVIIPTRECIQTMLRKNKK